MLKRFANIIAAGLLLPSCQAGERCEPRQEYRPAAPLQTIVAPQGATLEARFRPPEGYTRISVAAGSYAAFLRRAPLKPHGAAVLYYDGRRKPNQGVYDAVLSYDAGDRDLQQCADAVMRLRAEYLFAAGRPRAIHFRFTNGFDAAFSRWMDGYRIAVSGNKASWVKKALPSSSHATLRAYLDEVYRFAGTLSLAQELQPVPYRDMKIGDVLIVGGSPGHAVTVMDMAVNASGRKVFILSQSYMPAQEIQVLHNRTGEHQSPWYELDEDAINVSTPEWTFTTGHLKRFAD